MTVAVVTLALALIAVLVANQRTLGVLNAAREQERKDWTRERQLLLNRIKPETAQYVEPETVHAPQAVDLFDDADYWESKEELAERGAREEVA
jgi:septum formation inhibitor-activating ATPase MinD